jgi:Zn-dependent M32 family carboxypeptidase
VVQAKKDIEKTLDLSRERPTTTWPIQMIDDANEGLTTAKIQHFFEELRRELLPMVRAISDQPPAWRPSSLRK